MAIQIGTQYKMKVAYVYLKDNEIKAIFDEQLNSVRREELNWTEEILEEEWDIISVELDNNGNLVALSQEIIMERMNNGELEE